MSDATSALALPNFPGASQRIDNTGVSWGSSAWFAQLQPGSWRGVGFVMDVADTAAGRRVAIHEYPYRDTAWAEDLGKLPRRFSVQAFLVGDDVYQQRDAMLRACEQPGPGTLVHPTLGSVQVVLLDFSVQDRRERGRYIEVALRFILAGDVQYPASAISSANVVASAATALDAAAQGDLAQTLDSAGNVVAGAAAQVAGFTSMATQAVGDAARIFNSVRGLVGIYGRYASGSRMTTLDPLATVASTLAHATATATAVQRAASDVQTLAASL